MVKRLDALATHVESLSDEYEALTDDELRAKTAEFKERSAAGESLDEMLPEAFATAREAAWRVLGQKPFHVQIMGAAALHFGNIAEMKTGEGKTLTSVLAAYLNALSGDGVHVVTTNDYLAKRDSEWMGRVHRFLGLEVGAVLTGMKPDERRVAYGADITYGTNNEFGFDYLRDNMAHSLEELVQRGHNYAIVDEVDSILIDEARTPLIISGPADSSSKWYVEFARIAPLLELDKHYEVDIRKKTVGVHEAGVEFVEDQLGIDNLYEPANSALVSYLNNAIKVKELFERDKDYIVRGGEVMIVDEFTGRVLDGRRFNEGLHQAIEAKEGVEIQAENQTLATITLQNYFRMYDKLSGMTGTAETEAAELDQIYKLGVLPIPTNRPMIRKDETDLIYKTEEAKFAAVVDDVTERHEKGQPVLIGTTSVERSEYLSRQLERRGIPHTVLNAKFHEQEAQIVAQAGRTGGVTVATNMAGRGTDVVLGGNPDIIADMALRKAGLDPVDTPDEYEAAWDEVYAKVKAEVAADAEKVREVGGLYVLGTERHESRRIDNQLRGRSGRQGDPGETRFYLSLGDELMRRFNGAALESIMNRVNLPDDVPIEAKMVSKAIRSAQTQVEQQNFEIRKNVLKYDEVMNQQRKVVYAERRKILEGADNSETVRRMIGEVIEAYVTGATAEGYVEDWDLDELWTAIRTLYPITLDYKQVVSENEYGEREEITPEDLTELIVADALSVYDSREEKIDGIAGEGAMRQLERTVLLTVIDRKWRDHLYEMDYLREGIHLRSMAQRDPVVEYQREGFDMFTGMLDGMKEETVQMLFHVEVEAAPAEAPIASAVGPIADAQLPEALRGNGSGDSEDDAVLFSGPSEGGGLQTHTFAEEEGGAESADSEADTALASASRRERRAAARADARGSRNKPAKSRKRR
ncbi:preprotein translocase subunit SecA [Gordonia jinhuaensis]|uniref:Protein translocase subunit SecA n=2 Tax=Gordonia jinhuaensis TaxID=1517702 RepID=A0A916T7C3_9ACTN|nr:protein translocase subunit SecA [Gordonia jinhuaensis]